MKIVAVGGGPAGLYFAILMKKAFPGCAITVLERNRAEDAYGWGVVFSAETLGSLEAADPESFAQIRSSFIYWDDIETWIRGEKVVSTGHGFCGLSRKRLLQILHARCRALGVELVFEKEVAGCGEVGSADLIVACDGVNSVLREERKERFRPSVQWGRCRFSWLGTTKALRAFTFVFEQGPDGLFVVHAYPFEPGLSTWIVECHEDTWKRAGLDTATEAETVAYCERLFAGYLDGHRLLSNRSVWRSFPTVANESWHDGPVVLLGDAAHTAHFSIGSGTKLAMEDAIALVEAFRQEGTGQVAEALAAYEIARRVEVAKLQRAAKTSREWFEHADRFRAQHPIPFLFNLMTRSQRITYENLRLRDPGLIDRVDAHLWSLGETARSNDPASLISPASPVSPAGSISPGNIAKPPAPIFTGFQLRGLHLANRIVVSPMCQYSAQDGTVNDWHLVHLGSRALGGAGLVMTEMTDVTADGRITLGCAGLYSTEHREAWRRIVRFVHEHSEAKIGIQLAHAGRKGSTRHPWGAEDTPLPASEGGWTAVGPSPVPFLPDWPAPQALDRSGMDRIVAAFAHSAVWAGEAGFDLLEIHMAHGYLLSSFLSPASNVRTDAYGGPLERRLRFPLDVLDAVRAAWPEHKPISVRISATDWLENGQGMTPEEAVAIARALAAHGCDIVDVSTAGNVPESRPDYGRMYQVPFAEKIRYEAGIPVIAVGAILNADHANTVIGAERADLCALARAHLADPYLTLHAAARYGNDAQPWPPQYLAAKPRTP